MTTGQTLIPLRLACVPRPDVLKGGLDGNHFAAQLDKVVRDPQDYPVYGNPEEFFASTFPTSGLKTMLAKVFGRITGASGSAGENGVLRPETSFGGGKTHGLTAIYHLAKGARPTNIAEFIDPALLPDGPVQVAALVGDALDPASGVDTGGHHTHTMWGEMAAQIGEAAFQAMAENDASRTAPGTGTIKRAFGGKPTIVIIDEIAKYLRTLSASGNEDVRRMAQAVPVFLGNLFEVASDKSNRVSVVITLASTANAFSDETSQVSGKLDEEDAAAAAAIKALEEVHDVGARAIQPAAVITPADDSEIGEILKKRLFVEVDRGAAQAAGAAYQALYEHLARTEQLAGGPEQPADYGGLVAHTYPFHPELIRVLDKRLGAIPEFQRARGALKLLAEVVAGIYRYDDDAAIINLGDIYYRWEPVLNHMTIGLGRREYKKVAESDFAGDQSHAAALDKELFPGKDPFATRVARTVFTHSLELQQTAGAGRNDWLIGTMRPGDDVSFYEKALAEAANRFWFLSFDSNRWRFTHEPNVNAIIESEKRSVLASALTATVDDLIARSFQNDGGVKTILFPAGPVDVPDSADALRVVVIDYRQLTVTGSAADTSPPMLSNLLDKSGASGNLRTFRNSVVFVVADTNQIEGLKDRAKAQIAAKAIKDDAGRLSQFDKAIQDKVKAYYGKAELDAKIAVNRAYRHVYFPAADPSNEYLRHRELSAQAIGDAKSPTTTEVLTLLDDEGKIRIGSMTPQFLRSKTWNGIESVSTKDILEAFWRDHGAQIILNPSEIWAAVKNGISNQGWVYTDGSGKVWTGTSMAGLNPSSSADNLVMTTDEARRRGLLVSKPTQQDVAAILNGTTTPTSGATLRSGLEARVGGEPPKGEVLDALAAAAKAAGYDQFVVVEGEPAPGIRALTPTQITEKGLDNLTILPRAEADAAGVEVPKREVSSKTFTAEGAGGTAIQAIIDQVTDFAINTVSRISLRVVADDASGTQDIDLAVAMLGMLPKHTVYVTSLLNAEFKDLPAGSGLRFEAKHTDRTAYQAAHTQVKKALSGASKIGGNLTIEARFEPPTPVTDPQLSDLVAKIRQMQFQHTTLTAEVAK